MCIRDRVYTKSDTIIVKGNGGTTDDGTREWHIVNMALTLSLIHI